MDSTFQRGVDETATTLRMSKIERLNARVAKLLTVAVQEVLEVVKETVSEYQEKTARTQRENDSLKRRLQELQDKLKREGTYEAPTSVSGSLPEDDPDADGKLEFDLDPSLDPKQDSGLCLPEHTAVSHLEPDHKPRQESKELEPDEEEVESLAKCVLAQAPAEHCTVQLEEPAEKGPAVNAPQSVKRDVGANSPGHPSTSHPNTPLGLSLAAIKTEPEPTDCDLSELPTGPGAYDGCVDLSLNSACYDPADAQKAQFTGHYGPVFVPSNHSAVARRHGFSKVNRLAFDSKRARRDPFRLDDPHICFVCGKSFSRVGNLRIHQRCHTGEKPYGCTQCGRCFTQAGDLKKHKRVHTGEKPYYCHQCGKSFSRGENLKRHQKIHIGKRLQLQHVWREHQ